MTIEENKALVKAFISAVNEGRASEALDMLADDFDMWVIGKWFNGGHHSKADMVRQMTENARPGGKQLQTIPVSYTAEEDRVCVEATSFIENEGRTYNQVYHFMFRLRDDMIIRVHEYLDTQEALEFFNRG